MSQNTVKKTLSYVAAVVGVIIATAATGAIHLPSWAIGWLGVVATSLGIFGASPIGRVKGLGKQETRTVGPTFPPPDDEDDRVTPRSRPVVTR